MNRPQLKPLLLSSTLLGLAGIPLVAVAPAYAQNPAPQAAEDNDIVVVTGVGVIVGLVMWSGGVVDVGATLVVFNCILAVVAGLGLALAVLKGLYRKPRLGVIGAVGQAAAPAITLIAVAAGW